MGWIRQPEREHGKSFGRKAGGQKAQTAASNGDQKHRAVAKTRSAAESFLRLCEPPLWRKRCETAALEILGGSWGVDKEQVGLGWDRVNEGEFVNVSQSTWGGFWGAYVNH